MSNLFENLQLMNENEKPLMEMANLVGKTVKTDKINFSFYFSDKYGVNHGIRVKIVWNENRMQSDDAGYLELHGDYKYIVSNGSKKIPEREIEKSRQFFKKYKVLFSAVWECEIDPNVLVDYLRSKCSFKDVLLGFDDLSEEHTTEILKAKDINDLERIVRKFNIFNMND